MISKILQFFYDADHLWILETVWLRHASDTRSLMKWEKRWFTKPMTFSRR
jgi:hypothetical protein